MVPDFHVRRCPAETLCVLRSVLAPADVTLFGHKSLLISAAGFIWNQGTQQCASLSEECFISGEGIQQCAGLSAECVIRSPGIQQRASLSERVRIATPPQATQQSATLVPGMVVSGDIAVSLRIALLTQHRHDIHGGQGAATRRSYSSSSNPAKSS